MIQAQPPPEPAEPAFSAPAGQFPDHLRDASRSNGKADRIFFPTTEPQVAQILRRANAERIAVTPSGARTGLAAAAVPQGGVLLSTERMKEILEIQWNPRLKTGVVSVEPGVTLEELDQALAPRGFFYPPNPGEKKASLGGTVATNASGSRSYKYGPTRKFVQQLRLLLANGELLTLERGKGPAQGGGWQITLSNGKTLQVPVPRYPQPPTKNSAGYFSGPGMELIDLFIGSEGTLGVITGLTLSILRKPEATLGGLLFFSSQKRCFDFSKDLKRPAGQPEQPLDPRVVEFFDASSLRMLQPRYPPLPPQAQAALYVEQECEPEQVATLRQAWLDRAVPFGLLPAEDWFSDKPEKQEVFRKLRYTLPALINERVAQSGLPKVGTDLSVPESGAEALFDFYLSQLPRSGLEYALFGHLGENHLHANLLPKNLAELEKARTLYGTLVDKTLALNGTISAEHGIGKNRIPYLKRMVGEGGLAQMARIKRALDPNGILNPGTIIPIELLETGS